MEVYFFNSLDVFLVFLVEDNCDVWCYIKDQLKDDFQILEVEYGKFGLEMVQWYVLDLIVLDVMMLEMDGYMLV